MKTLPIPDAHYLTAAEGWLDLGDHVSANEELENIRPTIRNHPLVLKIRCRVYAQAGKWEEAYAIADALVRLDPDDSFGWIHRSFALHAMKRTDEAWQNLLPGAEKFPGDYIISYNLACYTCQLGKIEEAQEWIVKAIGSASVNIIKEMAFNDPDLEPLWKHIGRI